MLTAGAGHCNCGEPGGASAAVNGGNAAQSLAGSTASPCTQTRTSVLWK